MCLCTMYAWILTSALDGRSGAGYEAINEGAAA
jgi:hypothetical protein